MTNLSEKLYGLVPTELSRCLTDPIFAEFFYRLCAEKEIVEYYLTDERGSFLMLNAQGKPSWLAIANEEQMDSFYEIACGDKNTPQSILDALKTKKMLPYFYTDEDLESAPEDWEHYLYPATQLIGRNTYYYAYIEDSSAYQIEREGIFSYQQFLQAVR